MVEPFQLSASWESHELQFSPSVQLVFFDRPHLSSASLTSFFTAPHCPRGVSCILSAPQSGLVQSCRIWYLTPLFDGFLVAAIDRTKGQMLPRTFGFCKCLCKGFCVDLERCKFSMGYNKPGSQMITGRGRARRDGELRATFLPPQPAPLLHSLSPRRKWER